MLRSNEIYLKVNKTSSRYFTVTCIKYFIVLLVTPSND